MTNEEIKKDYNELWKNYNEIKEIKTETDFQRQQKNKALERIKYGINLAVKSVKLKKKLASSDEQEQAKLLRDFFGEFRENPEFIDKINQKQIEENRKELYKGENDKFVFGKNKPMSLFGRVKQIFTRQKEVAEEISKNEDIYGKYLRTDALGEVDLVKAGKKKDEFNFAAKVSHRYSRINKKEFINAHIAHKILPYNTPAVYNNSGTMVIESIDRDCLKDICESTLIKNNPKIVLELGKLIATMHNHNFVHGDLHCNNIMLDKHNVWKLINFGNYKCNFYGEGMQNINSKVIDESLYDFNSFCSDSIMNNTFKNILSQSYLINRNFSKIASYLIQKKDIELLNKFFSNLSSVTKEITTPSQEVKNYFLDLINQIDKDIQIYCPNNEELKKIFENFKRKIRNKIGIDLDENQLAIQAEKEIDEGIKKVNETIEELKQQLMN